LESVDHPRKLLISSIDESSNERWKQRITSNATRIYCLKISRLGLAERLTTGRLCNVVETEKERWNTPTARWPEIRAIWRL
jgi:hypothetical protein